ncbi:hypothetical protein PPACK8108_LOCUS26146 [Phakopsora pachyrhizi]|uniref:Hemerythrin-like domain-containing protein n=1 Tax=Phakopsora pachyrhizi TaxID=170000 RepID=A0AAV0BU37_PHAPC|nr:hypothetical protein PPACK8108_LOCUS26146 [Phakopsora pachyrhizi]
MFEGWIGEELFSGLIHGIYTGDYSQLSSAKSTIFGLVWTFKCRHGWMIRGLMSNHNDNNKRNSQRALEQEQELKRLMAIERGLHSCSICGLRGHLERLVESLRNHLLIEDNFVLMGH